MELIWNHYSPSINSEIAEIGAARGSLAIPPHHGFGGAACPIDRGVDDHGKVLAPDVVGASRSEFFSYLLHSRNLVQVLPRLKWPFPNDIVSYVVRQLRMETH